MKKEYTNYSEALRDIFKDTMGGEFVNRTFTHKFDKDKVVTNQLITNGTHRHYAGFKVTILNKDLGEIVNQFFPFNQYLRTISDAPVVHLWEDSVGVIRWTMVPTDESVFEMNDAIDSWLHLYRKNK